MDDLTVTERAVLIGIRLANGEQLLTREVAQYLQMSHTGAYLLMARASKSAPVYQDEVGRWQLFRAENP